MKRITDWTQITVDSLSAMGTKIMTELPNILGAILLIIVGWLVAKLLAYIVLKALQLMKFDMLSEKIHTRDVLEKANISASPSKIISKFVYW